MTDDCKWPQSKPKTERYFAIPHQEQGGVLIAIETDDGHHLLGHGHRGDRDQLSHSEVVAAVATAAATAAATATAAAAAAATAVVGGDVGAPTAVAGLAVNVVVEGPTVVHDCEGGQTSLNHAPHSLVPFVGGCGLLSDRSRLEIMYVLLVLAERNPQLGDALLYIKNQNMKRSYFVTVIDHTKRIVAKRCTQLTVVVGGVCKTLLPPCSLYACLLFYSSIAGTYVHATPTLHILAAACETKDRQSVELCRAVRQNLSLVIDGV